MPDPYLSLHSLSAISLFNLTAYSMNLDFSASIGSTVPEDDLRQWLSSGGFQTGETLAFNQDGAHRLKVYPLPCGTGGNEVRRIRKGRWENRGKDRKATSLATEEKQLEKIELHLRSWQNHINCRRKAVGYQRGQTLYHTGFVKYEHKNRCWKRDAQCSQNEHKYISVIYCCVSS